MNKSDCNFWQIIKNTLRPRAVLYTTKYNRQYKFVVTVKNRAQLEVLKYAIPSRDGIKNNHKYIPAYVLCAAYEDFKKGIIINKSWLQTHFMEIDNAGGCNIKVIESLLKKFSKMD